MPATPTRDDRFAFGLWTVEYGGVDPFGGPTRPALDVVEVVERLNELEAYGLTFHDDDPCAFGSTPGRTSEADRPTQGPAAYVGGKGFGFVRLKQLMIEHLMGAGA